MEQLGQIQWKYPDPTRRIRSNVVSATCHQQKIRREVLGRFHVKTNLMHLSKLHRHTSQFDQIASLSRPKNSSTQFGSKRPGEPLPRRLATGDLLTNCKICEKVRLDGLVLPSRVDQPI